MKKMPVVTEHRKLAIAIYCQLTDMEFSIKRILGRTGASQLYRYIELTTPRRLVSAIRAIGSSPDTLIEHEVDPD